MRKQEESNGSYWNAIEGGRNGEKRQRKQKCLCNVKLPYGEGT